jgi:predicted esterase
MPPFSCVRSFAAAAALAACIVGANEEPSSLRGARAAGEINPNVTATATGIASGGVGAGAEKQLVPTCSGMVRVTFHIKDFFPTGSGFPASSSGDMDVYGCSNNQIAPVFNPDKLAVKGVVLFLHGAGGHADDYADIYPSNVYRPDDYNIIFLQTPRGTATTSSWMSTDKDDLDHHWDNDQVMDNMFILSQIIDTLAKWYPGQDGSTSHPNVWIAGFSQGAVLSSAVALKATSRVLAGAFIVAGYPPRPLYTNDGGAKDLPSDWSADVVEEKEGTKIYFYTGELDATLPISESFCRYNRVVQKYRVSSANYRFWSKTGYCHFNGQCGKDKQISPSGNEFHALWHLVSGEPDSVAGVVTITPSTDCTA